MTLRGLKDLFTFDEESSRSRVLSLDSSSSVAASTRQLKLGVATTMFFLIKPIGTDMDDLGLWLQGSRVHANNGKELTQARHRDGGRRETTDMVSKVEFN